MKNHTPGPWKTLCDPEHVGRHPLHENRYVATRDAQLEEGSLICAMRDQECQKADARLIALAPELLALVREIAQSKVRAAGEIVDDWKEQAQTLLMRL